MNDQLDLAIVMPAYNEQDCIKEVTNEWITELRKLGIKFNFLILNDGSKDNTLEKLKELEKNLAELTIIDKENEGHGITLYRGYQAALKKKSKYVFHVDSDDQFDPADFKKLWDKKETTNSLIGIRINRDDPFSRLVITFILKIIVLFVFGVYIPDSNCPFRLFKSEALARGLEKIPPLSFAPNIFLSIYMKKSERSTSYIPVRHKPRTTGTVSIVRLSLLQACLKVLRQTLIFRMNL